MSHRRRSAAAVGLVALLALGATLVGCSEDKTLKITGIDPKQGDFNGGQLVRISGNRFVKDGVRSAKVYFGSRQGTVVRFAGDSELIVQAPGGELNQTVDVMIIFEPGGEKTLSKAFTFVEPKGVGVEDLDIKK